VNAISTTSRRHTRRRRSLPSELASWNPRSTVLDGSRTVDHSTVGRLVTLGIVGQTRGERVRGSRPGVAVRGAHADEEFTSADEARLKTEAAIVPRDGREIR